MDTILASIRRILNEDEVAPAEAPPIRAELRAAEVRIPEVPPRAGIEPRLSVPGAQKNDVLVLKEAMMVPPEKPESPPSAAERSPMPAPQNSPPVAKADAAEPQGRSGGVEGLVAARTRAAAAQSFDALHDALRRDEPPPGPISPKLLRAGGPTVEDLVRDELRSLLSNWLDVHLPALVETLVRSEIEKLTRR